MASDAAFLVQGHGLLTEQLFPYWASGKKVTVSVDSLENIHDRLSMEIGVHELSPRHYSYKNAGGLLVRETLKKVAFCGAVIG